VEFQLIDKECEIVCFLSGAKEITSFVRGWVVCVLVQICHKFA